MHSFVCSTRLCMQNRINPNSNCIRNKKNFFILTFWSYWSAAKYSTGSLGAVSKCEVKLKGVVDITSISAIELFPPSKRIHNY